ncbi:fatty acid desaturase [Lentibacter algarum]|uniref:fatty acid desaturase n=1 Tax=Lentibacter algarum TaxID=576131 RepID=UPI001C07373B|nr:fatty acid desaturase [Lentibacter algarum]MBU2981094.1 fatty acid desaturase [Lentibacter algarum]
MNIAPDFEAEQINEHSRAKSAQAWIRTLAKYREPSEPRSYFELAVTAIPFLVLWALAWAALSVSPLLALALSLPVSAFLLRLFTIQHDCGHGSLFRSRTLSDWIGRSLGVLTLTPYDVWRRSHSIHHASHGNLAKRGIGDIVTLTVDEYNALTPLRRLQYRAYRSPFFLFGFVPAYLFFIQQRYPAGLTSERKYWISAMGSNVALLAILGLLYAFGGWGPILYIFIPSTVIAATIGMWLFYVQHQFEHTNWDQNEDWQLHDSALHGSSYYVMPPLLNWFSANIGIHHVHHLYSRIPFYRLPEVLRDNDELDNINRMTIPESFHNARLHLWDEAGKRLLSFREARELVA